MTTKFMDYPEIVEAIDEAMLQTLMTLADEWKRQTGELGIPAHAYMNKAAGAMELRNNLRELIYDAMKGDTDDDA